MATDAFYERETAFYKQQADLEFVLSHPDFRAPDHPYIEQLKCLAQYAIFGLIDKSNGRLYANSTIFQDSVIIAPVLDKDLKMDSVSVSPALLRAENGDDAYDLTFLRDGSAICFGIDNMQYPIVSLAPYMNDRHPLVVGATVAHELDHAYWWLRRKTKFKEYDHTSKVGIAAQEISANRLEQQIFFAHTPEMYDEEYGKISLKYADHDFERVFKPRHLDKLRKSVRVVAFINFMFDSLGADVGKRPSRDVIDALIAQKLM